MKKIPAGLFKTNCLRIMDEVHDKHEAVIITKGGRPVAKLVPVGSAADEIYDFLAGKGSAAPDVVSPAPSRDERYRHPRCRSRLKKPVVAQR